MLYEELLNISKDRLDNFFENVELFDNQFRFENYNKNCYEFMYKTNSYSEFKTVKELKTIIPELAPLCKLCASFYMSKRNKSIPKYDVILGKQLEELLMEFLSKKLGTTVKRGDLHNRSYPDCAVYNNDDEIVAYMEVKFHAAPFIIALQKTGRYCYEGSATLDYKKIEKQLEIIDNEIDVPVLYVHWIEYPCLKGVFFETSEQVRTYINEQHAEFERKEREGDLKKSAKARYTKKMYSPLLEMGDFETLVDVLSGLL